MIEVHNIVREGSPTIRARLSGFLLDDDGPKFSTPLTVTVSVVLLIGSVVLLRALLRTPFTVWLAPVFTLLVDVEVLEGLRMSALRANLDRHRLRL